MVCVERSMLWEARVELSDLRQRVTRTLLDFAWNEWSQMGVLGTVAKERRWAADPEAHLLFAFQVARNDPRLFDETLDWLATNASLVSAQRLRNMAGSTEDKRLAEAVIASTMRVPVPKRLPQPAAPEPLFYELAAPGSADETFAASGFLRPPVHATGKSTRPDLLRPINFAYRLRSIFGVSSRAEVFRFLLIAGGRSPSGGRLLFTTPRIAEASGFVKRNVQDTLGALADARAVELVIRGKEHLYAADRDAWGVALGLAEVPQYRDWAHILLGLRELHRWLWQPGREGMTPYMLASEARLLFGQIQTSFTYAGVPVRERSSATGAEYWDVFVDVVEQLLNEVENGFPWG